MLFLLFHIGGDRYVIDAKKVLEVVPLVKLNNFSSAPDYIAGLCNYRGIPVPSIDIRYLIENVPSQPFMSTRILIVKYAGCEGSEHLLGVIAENAIETIVLEGNGFRQAAIQSSKQNYVSKIMTDTHGIIQWIAVDQLVSSRDCEILYGSDVEMVE